MSKRSEITLLGIKYIFAFIWKLAGAGAWLASGMLLGGALGASGFGAFSFVYACLQVLIVIAVFGVDKLVLRETARLKAGGAFGEIGMLRRNGLRFTLTTSTVCYVLSAGCVLLALIYGLKSDWALLLVAGLAIPAYALIRVNQGVVAGAGRQVIGAFFETAAIPLLFIALLFSLTQLSVLSAPIHGVFALISAAICVALCCEFYVRRLIPSGGAGMAVQWQRWIKESGLMVFIGAMFMLITKMDMIMLNILSTNELVGLYAAAANLSLVITMVQFSVNSVISSEVARLYAINDLGSLQRMITRTSQIVVLVSLTVALVFLFAGRFILSLYGDEFTASYELLLVLTVSAGFNASSGPVGAILMMTGHELYAARIVASGVLLNILANLILIPMLGALGAAIAALIATVSWNVAMVTIVVRKVKLDPTCFGFLVRAN